MAKENNKVCECCGCRFYVQKYRFEEAKYCSKKCFNEKWANRYVFNCQNCGKEDTAFGFTMGRKKYCSKQCMEEFRHTSIEELLNRGIEKKENGCWEWCGAIVPNGYGKITYKQKDISAHRASYIVFKGEIPKGKHVCHTCDNRKCVNPDHLWVGTHRENMQDMVNKGRQADQTGKVISKEHYEKLQYGRKNNHPGKVGSKHHLAKLDEGKVLEIKKFLSKGLQTTEIAAMFNVTQSNISLIKTGKRWTHVKF